MVGGGLSKLLGRALAAHAAGLDAVQQDAAAARLLELYTEKPAGQSSLYPGSAETLRDLRVAGVACGLCTNKPDAITRDLLQALGVGKAFGCILGNTAGLPKKPILPASTASWRASTPNRPPPSWSATVLPTCRRPGLPGSPPSCSSPTAIRPRRPMRSAPMPSSTRSTSSPPPLPCLLGGEGNPLDISNVCHCRAGPGNLVASADFCVYWIARLRRQ